MSDNDRVGEGDNKLTCASCGNFAAKIKTCLHFFVIALPDDEACHLWVPEEEKSKAHKDKISQKYDI